MSNEMTRRLRVALKVFDASMRFIRTCPAPLRSPLATGAGHALYGFSRLCLPADEQLLLDACVFWKTEER